MLFNKFTSIVFTLDLRTKDLSKCDTEGVQCVLYVTVWVSTFESLCVWFKKFLSGLFFPTVDAPHLEDKLSGTGFCSLSVR